MKRIAGMIMIVASVSAFAYMGPRTPMQPMWEALELTPAQRSELATIRKESRDERLKLRDAMQELRAKSYEKMMAVLDEKQRAELKAMRKQRFEQRAGQRAQRGGCDCPKAPVARTRCEMR